MKGRVEIVDAASGRIIQTLTHPGNPHRDNETVAIVKVLFSPTGSELVTHDDAGRIFIWDLQTNHISHVLQHDD
jgi:WD40 repeat protein